MATPRSISAERLMSFVGKCDKNIMFHGVSLSVRTMLTFEETSEFVNSVVSACYDEGRDAFVPEAFDFAFRANVIMRYSCSEMPDGIEEKYAIVYGTDLYETLMQHICRDQVAAVREAALFLIKS